MSADAPQPDSPKTVWLIERVGAERGPAYLTFKHYSMQKVGAKLVTRDPLEATWFSTREDADGLAELLTPYIGAQASHLDIRSKDELFAVREHVVEGRGGPEEDEQQKLLPP